MSVAKPPINVLHYVGADAYNGINGSFGALFRFGLPVTKK